MNEIKSAGNIIKNEKAGELYLVTLREICAKTRAANIKIIAIQKITQCSSGSLIFVCVNER
jgi:hypothetical protein